MTNDFIPGAIAGLVTGMLLSLAVVWVSNTPKPSPIIPGEDVKVRVIGDNCAAIVSYGPYFEEPTIGDAPAYGVYQGDRAIEEPVEAYLQGMDGVMKRLTRHEN